MYKFVMTRMSTAVARKRFSDVVNRVHYGKQRIALTTTAGHPEPVIVSSKTSYKALVASAKRRFAGQSSPTDTGAVVLLSFHILFVTKSLPKGT